MTTINPGDVRTVYTSSPFVNDAGVATDPTTITVRWRRHGGTETVWTYGTDAEVVRDGAGLYHADIPITASGLYYYKIAGSGSVDAAEEGTFLAETFFEPASAALSGPIRLYTGTTDPTTGAGVPATIGSVYSLTTLGSESVWVKTGAADTGWVQAGSVGGGVAGLTITDGVTSITATSLRMPSGTVVDAGGGVAAVGLLLSLVGPYRVNYNDPGIDVDGVAVATLDVGTLVVEAWLVMPVDFAAGGVFAAVSLGSGTGSLTEYSDFAQGTAGQEAASSAAVTHRPQFVVGSPRPLTVGVFPASGSFTVGAVDCYAIIATPAV